LNLKEYLKRYLTEHKVPKISETEASYLAEEITRGFEVLIENPNLSYDEWWAEVHEMGRDI